MKSKLKFILPVLLIAVGGVYKFVLAKPPVEAKKKVDGSVYVLPSPFLLNLNDGKFAKLGVALVLAKGFSAAPPAAGKEAAAPVPPEGYGVLPQEGLVRSIVTDIVTDSSEHALITKKGRKKLTSRILTRIRKQTDVKLDQVLLTDVAVQ